jgi:hypothetical protein
MSTESCAFWLDVIAGGALALWLAAAVFVAFAVRRAGEAVGGEIELPGEPAAVTQRLAAALARGAGAPLLMATLDEVTAATIAWHGSTGLRHRGSLQVERAGGGSLVRWEVATGTGLLTAARWVSALGLFVVAGLYGLLTIYVLPAAAGVREQVLQMVQAIHVLWPPFLLAGLHLVLRRRVAAEVGRLVQNQRWPPPA